MKHLTLALAGILAAAVSGAAAQDLTTAAPTPGPRVELGAGGAWYLANITRDRGLGYALERPKSVTTAMLEKWAGEGGRKLA